MKISERGRLAIIPQVNDLEFLYTPYFRFPLTPYVRSDTSFCVNKFTRFFFYPPFYFMPVFFSGFFQSLLSFNVLYYTPFLFLSFFHMFSFSLSENTWYSISVFLHSFPYSFLFTLRYKNLWDQFFVSVCVLVNDIHLSN